MCRLNSCLQLAGRDEFVRQRVRVFRFQPPFLARIIYRLADERWANVSLGNVSDGSRGFRYRQALNGPHVDWGEIGEVAEAAVWLCSDAAAYVTGTIIDVDGGSQVGDASRMDLVKGLG